MTTRYVCGPVANLDTSWREVLERLIERCSREREEDVAELGDFVVLRLRQAGVTLHALRRTVDPRFWVDAGRGALEVTVNNVMPLLLAEVRGSRLSARVG